MHHCRHFTASNPYIYRRISREASPAEATADEKGTQVYILNTRSRSSPENNESVQAVGQYRVGHVFDN